MEDGTSKGCERWRWKMAGLDSITTCDFNWDVCRDTALDRVDKWMCLSDVVNISFFSEGWQ